MTPAELPDGTDDEAVFQYLEATSAEVFAELGVDPGATVEDLRGEDLDRFSRAFAGRLDAKTRAPGVSEQVRGAIVETIAREAGGDLVINELLRQLNGEDFSLDGFLQRVQDSEYSYTAVSSLLGQAEYLSRLVPIDELFVAYKRFLGGQMEGMDQAANSPYILNLFVKNYATFVRVFGEERAAELRAALSELMCRAKGTFNFSLELSEIFEKDEIILLAKAASALSFESPEALESFIATHGLPAVLAAKRLDIRHKTDQALALARHFGEGDDEGLAKCIIENSSFIDGDEARQIFGYVDKKVATADRPRIWGVLLRGATLTLADIMSSETDYDKKPIMRFLMERELAEDGGYKAGGHAIRTMIKYCVGIYDAPELLELLKRCDEAPVESHYDRLPVSAVDRLIDGPFEKKLDHIIAWSKVVNRYTDEASFWDKIMGSSLPVEERLAALESKEDLDTRRFWTNIAPELDESILLRAVRKILKDKIADSSYRLALFLKEMPLDDRERAMKVLVEGIKDMPKGSKIILEEEDYSPELKRLTFEVMRRKDELLGEESGYIRRENFSMSTVQAAYDAEKFEDIYPGEALEILRSRIEDSHCPFCFEVLYKNKESNEYKQFADWAYEELSIDGGGVGIETFRERFDWYLGQVFSLKRGSGKLFLDYGYFSVLTTDDHSSFERFKSLINDLTGEFAQDLDKLSAGLGLANFVGSGQLEGKLTNIEEGLNLVREIGDIDAAVAIKEVQELYRPRPIIWAGLLEVAKSGGKSAISEVLAFDFLYKPELPDADERFKRVRHELEGLSSVKDAYRQVSHVTSRIGTDIECFEYFCSLAKGPKVELLGHFRSNNSDIYKNTLELFKIGEHFYDQYGLRSKRLTASYFETVKREGVTGADEVIHKFMEELPALRQRAIGLEPDLELRAHPFYLALLEEVFGQDTRYTNVERNLEAPDADQNLADFDFPKGRKLDLVIKGTNGYKLKDGVEEGVAAQTAYQQRVKTIETFVLRGGDKDKLKEAYGQRVDEFLEATVMKDHVEVEGLSVQEKLLIVLLDQGLKKQRRDEVLDLLVLYKFVFEYEISDFVNETAERVQAGVNEVSQRFQQWVELQEVYGENLKHSLEHEIFPGVPKDSFSEITETYLGLAVERDEEPMEDKNEQKVRALLGNERISTEKLGRAVGSNLVGYFTRGLKPDTQAQLRPQVADMVERFFEDLVRHLQERRPTFEDLAPLLKDLRELFLRTKFDPEFQVSELAKTDYNRITQEIGKYEENVSEGEAAERIEGYFTMTKESANARMSAAICIGEDPEMYKNPNYFEFVLKEGGTGECLGLSMFLNIEKADGRKYLYFAPNPSQACLEKYSESEVFAYLKRVALDFAKANNYDGVVIPANEAEIYGACTNRGGKFLQLLKKSRLKDKEGFKTVDFDEKVWLSQGRFKYGYEAGALIWEGPRG